MEASDEYGGSGGSGDSSSNGYDGEYCLVVGAVAVVMLASQQGKG